MEIPEPTPTPEKVSLRERLAERGREDLVAALDEVRAREKAVKRAAKRKRKRARASRKANR